MNNVNLLIIGFIILIVFGVGYYITVTLNDEIENHPEIVEIGAPPRIEFVMITTSIVALVVCLALVFGKAGVKNE